MAAPRLKQRAPLPPDESMGPSILDSKTPLIYLLLPAAAEAADDVGASRDLSVAQLQDLKLLGTSGAQPGATTPNSVDDEELWSVKDPRVQTCVCTFDLRVQIDLRKLVNPLVNPGSNFELTTSGLRPVAVYRHLRSPRYTAMVWASGKARLHTSCEEAESRRLANSFAKRIQKAKAAYGPVKFKRFAMGQLTVSAGVGFQMDLAGLVEELQARGQQHGISVISAKESSVQVQLATHVQHGLPQKCQMVKVHRDGKMSAFKAPNVVEAVHEMDRLLPWLKQYRIWW